MYMSVLAFGHRFRQKFGNDSMLSKANTQSLGYLLRSEIHCLWKYWLMPFSISYQTCMLFSYVPLKRRGSNGVINYTWSCFRNGHRRNWLYWKLEGVGECTFERALSSITVSSWIEKGILLFMQYIAKLLWGQCYMLRSRVYSLLFNLSNHLLVYCSERRPFLLSLIFSFFNFFLSHCRLNRWWRVWAFQARHH